MILQGETLGWHAILRDLQHYSMCIVVDLSCTISVDEVYYSKKDKVLYSE